MKRTSLRSSLSIALLAAVALSAGPVLAQPAARPAAEGEWTFTSVAAAGAGAPRCELSRAVGAGLTAILASQDGKASLLLSNPAWKLPEAVYDVTLEGEGLDAGKLSAKASPAGVSVDLGEAASILPKIAGLDEIRLRTAQTVIPLSLAGAAEGVRRLEDCESEVAAAEPAPKPAAEPASDAPRVAAAADCSDAKAHFDIAKEIGTREAFQAHVDAYPDCSFAPFARMLMGGDQAAAPTPQPTQDALKKPAEPTDDVSVVDEGLDAEAIADALVERLNATLPTDAQGPGFEYEDATADGEDVTITGFGFTGQDEAKLMTRLLFEETVLRSPVLAEDGSLSAASVEMRDGATSEKQGDAADWAPSASAEKVQMLVGSVTLNELALPAGGGAARIAGYQMEGVKFLEDGEPLFALASVESQIGELVGGFPKTMTLKLTTEPIAVAVMKKGFEGSESVFDDLGYPDYTFDFTLDFAADPEARTLTVNDLVLTINDEAAIALNFVLGGFDVSGLTAGGTGSDAMGQALGAAALTMTLNSAGFGYGDDGMLPRALDAFAKASGVELAVLKAIIPAQLKEAVAAVSSDPAIAEKLQAAATEFFASPDSIGIHLDPATPVSMLEFITVAAGGDAVAQALITRLKPVIVVNELEPIIMGSLEAPALSQEAKAAIAECARLAADADDPNKPADVAGVSDPGQIEHVAAIPACEAAHAAAPNDPQSTFQLGRSYYAAGRFEDAVRLYNDAADQGQKVARYEVGRAYHNGEGVARDIPAAIAIYEELADELRWAAASLANIYYFGAEGVTPDVPKAMGYWQKAADQGDANAKVSLAVEYINGASVPADYPRAKTLLEEAADAGNAGAMAELGKMYFRGQGVAADPAEAYRQTRKAADLGDPIGLSNAAYMLAQGYGATKDPKEAARMMLSAYALGDPDAAAYLVDDKAESLGLDFRRAVQRSLRESGVYSGRVDGAFGEGTLAALEAYKKKTGS